jgi:hypothetical protein
MFGYHMHIPTINTGYIWLDWYLYFCVSMFCLMVYRRWLQGKLSLLVKVAMAPILIVFGIVDVIANHTICRILGAKPYGSWTISQRFEYYRDSAYSPGFNKMLANFCCGIINQFDDLHC